MMGIGRPKITMDLKIRKIYKTDVRETKDDIKFLMINIVLLQSIEK